jgi:nucleoid-associated protein YgaU
MQVSGPAWGPSFEWHKAILLCVVVCCLFSIPAFGQDVADAARKEKERKAAEQKDPRHVYTEEDLKKGTILTPEDQARVEARKQKPEVKPAQQNAEQLPSNSDPSAESLGEIARRFRREQGERQAELDAKKKFSAFPYDTSSDVLAEPTLEVSPLIAPMSKPTAPVRQYVMRPVAPAAVSRGRVSPFQPRPLSGLPGGSPAAIVAVPGTSIRKPDAPPAVERKLQAARGTGTRQIEATVGQSWWKLAEQYLGDGARWQELRKLNVDAGGPPELLRLGSKVVVPDAAKKNPVGPEMIKVKKGDTLWSLAQEHFGRGSAWACLASANPQIVDYTHMAVGTVVRLVNAEALASCQNLSLHDTKR